MLAALAAPHTAHVDAATKPVYGAYVLLTRGRGGQVRCHKKEVKAIVEGEEEEEEEEENKKKKKEKKKKNKSKRR